MPQQYYNLTYRQFTNMVNGYFKQKETESRERLTMMRNIMFAALSPRLKIKKPSDIMKFDWENNLLKNLEEEDFRKIESGVEKVKDYWKNIDEKRKKIGG